MNRPIVGLAQHIGKRKEQQDTVRMMIPAHGVGVWIADGIGGSPGGATASLLAVRAARAAFLARDNMDGMFMQANKAVCEGQRKQWNGGPYPEMGTTLVAFAWYTPLVPSMPATWVIGSVGDSRAYVLQPGDNELIQMTKDEQLHGALIQWIGMPQHLTVEPQVIHQTASPGQVVLLCSDGLSNAVTSNILLARLMDVRGGRRTPHEAAAILVDAAVRAGGSDNITAAVVKL